MRWCKDSDGSVDVVYQRRLENHLKPTKKKAIPWVKRDPKTLWLTVMRKLCCYPSFSHFCCMYKVRFLLNGKCVYVLVIHRWFSRSKLIGCFSIQYSKSTTPAVRFFDFCKQWSNWANILIIENHLASPKVKVNIDEGYLENLLPTKYQFFCKLGGKGGLWIGRPRKAFFSLTQAYCWKIKKSASTVMPWCDIGHTKSIKQCIFNFSCRILLILKLFQEADIGNYRHEL